MEYPSEIGWKGKENKRNRELHSLIFQCVSALYLMLSVFTLENYRRFFNVVTEH